MTEPMFALALDPSLNDSGYAVARISPYRSSHRIEIVEASHIPNLCFDSVDFGRKLRHIQRVLYMLREVYTPSIVCKENLAPNSMSQMERLSPVHALIHMVFGDDIIGYAPTHIKKVVSGDGKSDKEDVAQSIQLYLLDKSIVSDMNLTLHQTDDVSDSIAILITMLIDKGYVKQKNTPPSD